MGEKRKRVDGKHDRKETFRPNKRKLDNGNGFKIRDKKPEGQRQKLIFNPRPDWHAAELPELPTLENPPVPDIHVLDDLHKYANTLLEAENAAHESSNSASSSRKFMSEIMSTGTMEDQISALTLLVQESPVHTKKAFENLMGLASKRSRSQALLAIAALKDLLGQGVLLPPERKLRAFNRQPALITALKGISFIQKSEGVPRLPLGVQKVHLISWAYEDWLKKQYFELLKTIEVWCNDEVEYARSRSVTFVFELLKEKPEQEENLLRLLVNKLGDTDKKIASRASYLLLQLQNSHPLMKSVIVNSIETEFLFRPGQSPHAKYNAIVTLNQTILSAKEQEVSNKLIEIYFKLFLGLIKKVKGSKDEGPQQGGGGKPGKMAKQKAKQKDDAAEVQKQSDEKMIAQILTGINRAFPYAETDDSAFENQLDLIYRVTHSSNFNTSLQALTLLQQISATKHFSADRYYRTLYESLLDPRLVTSSKHILYLNLLYRSLKADLNVKRVQAFVKRLLQIITVHEPPFACGVLFLLSELIGTFPSIKKMLDMPEDEDEEDEAFVDVQEDGEMPLKGIAPKVAQASYDGRKRDPQYANADRSCLWELYPFIGHFHPSVSLFASRLLDAGEMPPKPDPTLHTLMHFLDRFSYRNPKANATAAKGGSIFQPLVGADTADRLIKKRSGAFVENPLNTEAFWARRATDVAVDEVFFHNYFNQTNKKKPAKSKKGKRDADDSDEAEEDGEEEIWKALVSSKPDIEGDDVSDGFDSEELDYDEDEEEAVAEGDEDEDEDEDGDGGVVLNFGSDEEDVPVATGKKDIEDDEDDNFDQIDLDEEDAFLDSDEELPSDFDDAKDSAEEKAASKKKGKEKDEKKKKKRKLKSLPTFASADDYAKMLEGEEDGM